MVVKSILKNQLILLCSEYSAVSFVVLKIFWWVGGRKIVSRRQWGFCRFICLVCSTWCSSFPSWGVCSGRNEGVESRVLILFSMERPLFWGDTPQFQRHISLQTCRKNILAVCLFACPKQLLNILPNIKLM